MEKEKYYKAIEIAHKIEELNTVTKELSNLNYTTTLRFCRKWNNRDPTEKWKLCSCTDCIDDILDRHTTMVLEEIRERRNKLVREIDEL